MLPLFDPLLDFDIRSWKLGAGYTFGNFTVNAIYDNIKVKNNATTFTSATDTKRSAWGLNGVYNMGNIALKAGFYDAGKITDSTNTGAKMYEVGGDYNLSKRTKLYAVYAKVNNDNNAAYCVGGSADVGFGGGGVNPGCSNYTGQGSFRLLSRHAPHLLRTRGLSPLFLEAQTGPRGPVCISLDKMFRIETVTPGVKEWNSKMAQIGRNAPCPCGSGKKFKHCCGSGDAKPAPCPCRNCFCARSGPRVRGGCGKRQGCMRPSLLVNLGTPTQPIIWAWWRSSPATWQGPGPGEQIP